jgi:hypothetical protein
VRWADEVSASSRAIYEVLFNLTNGERLEGRSWSYDVIDPSFRNVRALVTSPAVADTHEINRDTFQISATAPKSAPGVWLWSAVPILGNPTVLALVVSALIGLSVLGIRRAKCRPSQLSASRGLAGRRAASTAMALADHCRGVSGCRLDSSSVRTDRR